MIGLSECIFVVEPLCFDLVSEIFKAVAPNFFIQGTLWESDETL